ncbi:hypothetical protein GCM10010468_33960 [Actinocorallia longicatena]|uniref:Uncharacterized protein n=1 Tax=Actinocorallia longicatena TaxID=111803 RepID=A0ABP6QFL2_9ACTN
MGVGTGGGQQGPDLTEIVPAHPAGVTGQMQDHRGLPDDGCRQLARMPGRTATGPGPSAERVRGVEQGQDMRAEDSARTGHHDHWLLLSEVMGEEPDGR